MLGTGAKIACRTIGTLGTSLILYDTIAEAKAGARHGKYVATGNQMEDAFFSTRTIDDVSEVESHIGKKSFEARTRCNVIPVLGSIKGCVGACLNSLGNNLLLATCSAFALASKGIMAKAGAIGVGVIGIYQILRQGFGLGKINPMD